MNIRQKVVAIVAALFVVLIALEIFVQERVLMPSFAELERSDAQTSMTRVQLALNRTLDGLESIANDWSDWGELYQFMQDRNSAFITTYTSVSAMAPLKVNMLMLLDINGNVVFSSARDLESGNPIDIDFAGQKVLAHDFPWRTNLSAGQPAQGLVRTNLGVMMLVAVPILDGTGAGRPRGMALMGRLFSSKQLDTIGVQAQVPLFMSDVGNTPSHEEISETDTATTVYRPYDDIYGRPLMYLHIEVPRNITARGHIAVNYSLWYLVGAAITVLILLLVTLNRLILSPIARVTRHAVAVGERGDLTARLNFRGTDEISRLAGEFDRMVESVAQSRRQLVDQSYQAGFAELAKGVMHNLGNAMTPLGVRLSVLSGRVANAPLADIEWAAAEFESGAADEVERRADLVNFIRLGCRELAATLLGAKGDIAAMERQTSIIAATLADQLVNTRNEAVLESVRLPDVVSQALDIVPDTCRQTIVIDADESLRAVGSITVERTVLRLILQNLIINAADAVRATGRDKGALHIAAEIFREDDSEQLHLECRDNGIGIEAQNLQRVFEKGFSTKSRETNHGIGLHWCANAIHSMGGRIWAVSEGAGRGASMHLVLPIGKRQIPAERLEMET
jgi:two-component system, NtrC family, sensor kinase